MKDKTRIQIDLTYDILDQLQFMADRDMRNRKNYIEIILIKAAEEYPVKYPKWKGGKDIKKKL